MKWKILLTLIFPGIIQISEGNLKLGIPVVILNWVFFYTLWPILMPIALGFVLKKDRENRIDIVTKEEESWKQDLKSILTVEN